ncbi:hypothetical protein [Streptomyces sp. NPDC001536]|uniref:hypothetical protein n=1 Tax=Streptomyces sp. NPDC001536 TaxID=3364583 RepID=UPI0036C5A79D
MREQIFVEFEDVDHVGPDGHRLGLGPDVTYDSIPVTGGPGAQHGGGVDQRRRQ